MIRVILWDIDGTLLDFPAAERAAIQQCFDQFDLGWCDEGQLERYHAINHKYWRLLEEGKMTRPQILVGRFEEFLAGEGMDPSVAADFNAAYQVCLGETVCFRDNGYRLVERLKGRVGQYAVTNGTKAAQDRKLEKSGLVRLFDGIFISEEVGVDKPNIGFFDHVFAHIPPVDRAEVLIVGDSLTSDMQGGLNAGIQCCWYNPNHLPLPEGMDVDFVIDDLNQVEEILFYS